MAEIHTSKLKLDIFTAEPNGSKLLMPYPAGAPLRPS
jgi:hypothetical protein